MTITDYLINAMFLLVVVRQARERELDRRSVIVPLILVFFVAQMYLHSIPTAGNDLVLIGLLAAVGLTLGIASGFATHVRAGENGVMVDRAVADRGRPGGEMDGAAESVVGAGAAAALIAVTADGLIVVEPARADH